MTAVSTIYLPPVGDRPAEPAPFLMTEEETVRLLRLTENTDPYSSLKRYRDRGWLKATQVGREVRYQLPDVLKFLETAKEGNPR